MEVNSSSVASVNATQVSSKKAEENTTQKSNVKSADSTQNLDKKTLEKLSSLGGKGIAQAYFLQFSQETFSSVFGISSAQSGISSLLNGDASKASSILSQIDFAALGYSGKNPLSMNADELNKLVSEEGFFGVANTANRIADFVINGAGDNLEKLQKGLEGMKRGFSEAEKMWGSKLPQISQDTINQALEKVTNRINELGGKALDIQA